MGRNRKRRNSRKTTRWDDIHNRDGIITSPCCEKCLGVGLRRVKMYYSDGLSETRYEYCSCEVGQRKEQEMSNA